MVSSLSLSLLLPQGEDFSPSAPAPAWGPFHRVRFSTNSSSVGHFHEVQSFRNRPLQCGSPIGSQALPANLLQCGLLSPLVYRSCQ